MLTNIGVTIRVSRIFNPLFLPRILCKMVISMNPTYPMDYKNATIDLQGLLYIVN